MNFKQNGKPLVLSLMVGLMFLLAACGGDGAGPVVPTAKADTYSVPAGGNLDVSAANGVLANDTGRNLTATLGANAEGNLILSPNGSFTYTPVGAAGTTDTFTYTANNSAGTSAAAIVTISITEPDNNGGETGGTGMLTAANDSYQTTLGTPLNVTAPGILSNDTNTTGEALTINVDDSEVEEGSILTVNQDGSFTYTPPATATEAYTDTFSYTLTAGTTTSNAATVTINVGTGEVVQPGEGPYNVNFQNQAATTPPDYFADYGQPYGLRVGPNQGTGQTYGWVTIANNMATQTPCDLTDDPATPAVDGNGRERGQDSATITQLLDTFMHMQGADVAANNNGNFTGVKQNCAWQIAVPNGTYNVALALGDAVDERNTSVSAVTAYQVRVESVVFPDPAYVPPATAGDGSIEQFAITPQPLSVNVTDGLLTVTPTGTNTKIAYITITAQ